jgi:hypothetical protein
LCAVLLTEACNVGFTPVIKPDVPALSRGRLVQVDQGYFRAENISVANGLFIEAQAKIDVVRGQRGELRQHYREGMEDQLGALGLALNCVVLFNSLYIDAAVKQLAADGFPVTDELLARLSPLQYDHINFLGRYAFTRPAAPGLRQLRAPHTDDEDDDGEQD